jgi:hypothetical protein
MLPISYGVGPQCSEDTTSMDFAQDLRHPHTAKELTIILALGAAPSTRELHLVSPALLPAPNAPAR